MKSSKSLTRDGFDHFVHMPALFMSLTKTAPHKKAACIHDCVFGTFKHRFLQNTRTRLRISTSKYTRACALILIVEFHRWSDRMEILTDGAVRDLIRRERIRVTSDLTTRQRNEIQYYQQQGKLAYFKNGKLRVEDRRPHPSGHRRPHPSQRSQQEHRGYHDDHDFRDHEDWPLPHRPDREATSEVWNQRSHRKWKDDRNQTRRREDDSRYKYCGQQRDRNASDRNGPSKQPIGTMHDHGRYQQQRDECPIRTARSPHIRHHVTRTTGK